jgi:MFS superfamily sulfate permease-like transporter
MGSRLVPEPIAVFRRAFAHQPAVAALVAVVLGCVLAAGLAVPAQAVGPTQLTVRVTSKTGTPITGLNNSEIEAVPITDHLAALDQAVPGIEEHGHPGGYDFAVSPGVA